MNRDKQLNLIVNKAQSMPVQDWGIADHIEVFIKFHEDVSTFLYKAIKENLSKVAVKDFESQNLNESEWSKYEESVSMLATQNEILEVLSHYTRNTLAVLRALNKSGIDTSSHLANGIKLNKALLVKQSENS